MIHSETLSPKNGGDLFSSRVNQFIPLCFLLLLIILVFADDQTASFANRSLCVLVLESF